MAISRSTEVISERRHSLFDASYLMCQTRRVFIRYSEEESFLQLVAHAKNVSLSEELFDLLERFSVGLGHGNDGGAEST